MEPNVSFDKKTNRNPFFHQMEKEVLDLIDPKTDAPFAHLTETIDCPVCGGKGAFFLTKWKFTYNQCHRCRLIYVSPRLTETSTLKLYQKDSKANVMWATSVNSSPHQQTFYKNYFDDHLSILKKQKSKGNLLDIGCGNGHFLQAAKQDGYRVKGIELEENALSIARKKGLNVSPMLLTDPALNSQSFDIITMFGVLEHLFEPTRDIKLIHSMLNKDGIFMGITPNAQSLVGMLLKHEARFYTPRNHPMIFSFKSLTYLFENAGFEIVHLDTVLTGYDSIVNSLQNKDPFSDLTFDFLPPKLKKRIKNKDAFEKTILNNDLGLRLRIIAQKRTQ